MRRHASENQFTLAHAEGDEHLLCRLAVDHRQYAWHGMACPFPMPHADAHATSSYHADQSLVATSMLHPHPTSSAWAHPAQRLVQARHRDLSHGSLGLQ